MKKSAGRTAGVAGQETRATADGNFTGHATAGLIAGEQNEERFAQEYPGRDCQKEVSRRVSTRCRALGAMEEEVFTIKYCMLAGEQEAHETHANHRHSLRRAR